MSENMFFFLFCFVLFCFVLFCFFFVVFFHVVADLELLLNLSMDIMVITF